MNKQREKRDKELAALIMDADLPKRLLEENNYLRRTRNYEVEPRWLRDEKTNELFERQGDGSYKVAIRLIPIAGVV